MPNVTVALPNIGGALCSTPQRLADAHYKMPCNNAAKTRNQLKFAGVPQLVNRPQPLAPGDGQTSRKVCLAFVERRRCSNEVKTRYPLKYAGQCWGAAN